MWGTNPTGGYIRGTTLIGWAGWDDNTFAKKVGQKENAMRLKKAILKGFNSGDYTATIQLSGSYKVYLQGVAVARNIPAAEMALGRKLAVIFFDEHNAKDAVVVGVYS